MKSKVWTKFVQTSDFTVKALTTLNSLNRRNFQTKIDMKVKIRFYAKLCTQNKILASKMQHLKQQKTSVFAPLILKRWIKAKPTPTSSFKALHPKKEQGSTPRASLDLTPMLGQSLINISN